MKTGAGSGGVRGLALVAVLVTAFAIPAGANAAAIEYGAYKAGPGETNDLTVSYEAILDRVTYTDAGVGTILDASGGDTCTVVGNEASCTPLPPYLRADLLDGDDRLTVTTALPVIESVLSGGEGNDTLSSGPGNPTSLPNVHLLGEGGNDTLTGSSGSDLIRGGPGNDIEAGGPGNDYFDGGPFFGATNNAAGADTMDGGPGSDFLNGFEPSDFGGGPAPPSTVQAPQAPDTTTCGAGDEVVNLLGWDPAFDKLIAGDEAAIGPGDTVATDCEIVANVFVCPEGDRPCVGRGEIDGTAADGGSRSAAIAGAGGRNRVSLGRGRFRIRPGEAGAAHVRLKAKKVGRVLGKRASAKVQALARGRIGRKSVTLGRKRFRISRG